MINIRFYELHVSWVGRETGYCSIYEPKMNSATEMISVPLRRLDGQKISHHIYF